ncbi:MAG: sulfotransferase [Nitrospirae bacterium]|jgi:hypothetical protein|nr:sulfotransferase [Nitrospirota bacterium]
MIKLPNFLIVGAAKSGTTSLYYYLNQHPEIYMSPIKEPKFITSQFLKFPLNGIKDDEVEKSIVKDFKEYCNLFKLSNNEKAIGEASADNLFYYENAILYIKKYIGEPKIIIILRNPVDRAFSAYLHLVRDKRETLTFEKALEEEEMRRKNNWEFIWFYKNVGFYTEQVKAYLKSFPNVKIYLFDDLLKEPLNLVQNLYKFLEVDNMFIPDMDKKYNVSLIPKSNTLHKFLTQPNVIKETLKPFLKTFISNKRLGNLVENTKNINLYKPKMKQETRKYLLNIYREDILKLQDLIKRDLSHWLK